MRKSMSSNEISLGNFLDLFGGNCVVTIVEEIETGMKYFYEEENLEDIYEMGSETYSQIKERMVKRFNVLGGEMCKVELYIYLK